MSFTAASTLILLRRSRDWIRLNYTPTLISIPSLQDAKARSTAGISMSSAFRGQQLQGSPLGADSARYLRATGIYRR
jgi:hypothetical protein